MTTAVAAPNLTPAALTTPAAPSFGRALCGFVLSTTLVSALLVLIA